MYKQKKFKKRRYSGASNTSGKRGYKSKGYGSSSAKPYWKKKNRRYRREEISHTRYISKDVNFESTQYVPENSFRDFDLRPKLAKNVSDMGYVNPTKIQDQAIPEILNGRDIVGIASTGSGKTGAFLIPMIEKALKNPQSKVLIVTPTRELATQINHEFRKFAKNTPLRMVLVIGGANMRTQISLLRNRPQFVVATPGRLIDLEGRNYIDLGGFNNVILDEVDQMLDMGFVEDIKMLIAKLANQRQSLFFSATMSYKEEAVANTLLLNPIKVEADKQSPLKSIYQDIVKVKSRNQKMQVLHDLLKKDDFSKVLVFSETKAGADNISSGLRKHGIMVDSLHGDKSHHKRSKVLTKFRQDKIDVLVATDVAARGIDIPDITHVINYDEPASYNDYIHRIGRTGRIGKKGTALTFVVNKNW